MGQGKLGEMDGSGPGMAIVRGPACRERLWAEAAGLPEFCVCRKRRFGCEEWNVPCCPPRAETAVEELEKKIAGRDENEKT